MPPFYQSQRLQWAVVRLPAGLPKAAKPMNAQTDLPAKWIDEVGQFFVNYHKLEGKKYELLGTDDGGQAMRLIQKARNAAK